eukprot:5063719-Heterocapsa_arctica.AAC.1
MGHKEQEHERTPVISFAADNRPETINSLTQTIASLWKNAANEHGISSTFIYFILKGFWEDTAI